MKLKWKRIGLSSVGGIWGTQKYSIQGERQKPISEALGKHWIVANTFLLRTLL